MSARAEFLDDSGPGFASSPAEGGRGPYSTSIDDMALRQAPTPAEDMLVRLSAPGQQDPAIDPLYLAIRSLVAERRYADIEARVSALVDNLLPQIDPMGAVLAQIEADNATLRVRFLETEACFPAERLAEMAGHEAENNRMTGPRWKKARKVFSVPYRGRDYYPAFQFADGRPIAAIKDILEKLPQDMTEWQMAFWFVSSCRWLDGAVPRDLLKSKPDLVLQAAGQEAGVVVG